MSFILRLIIAILIFFIVEFYFYKKVKNSIFTIFPNFSKKKFKIIFRVYLFFTNLFPVLLILYWLYLMITDSGRWAPVESVFFDYLVIYPFWISVLIIVQVIVILLPLDLFRLLLFPLYKKQREKVKRFFSFITVLLVSAAIIYVPTRIIYDYLNVSVRITEIKIDNLPPQLEGFKIAFISDTQADRYTDLNRLSNFLAEVNETNPDLVLMAGDVITGTPKYINAAAEALGKLKAPYGVYTCVGDHDNWAYREDNARSLREITSALKEQNVRMIDNANEIIYIDSASIKVSFATFTYSRRIEEQGLRSLANGNKEHDVDIFLTHQPNEFLIEFANSLDYDLFLAGHTHGGQLTILFPFINLTPTLIETNYVKGNFMLDDMHIIVTRGLGMSLAPIRYNSTPEITLIVLENKN